MRRAILGLGLVLGLSAFASEARAQNFSDPFFLYYGYFLPRQQAQAATPSVVDTINAATAARQGNATTNRANLYDPNGSFAPLDQFDGPGAGQRGDARQANLQSGQFPAGNSGGTGPGLYYSRTSRYYPQLRTGRGSNRNVNLSQRRGGFSGAGVPAPVARPNIGSGVPGPR